MSVDYFRIEERHEDGWTRLRLVGELDMAAVDDLEERLKQLSASHECVRVDLSQLDFIDSSGIRLLIHSLRDSRRDGWTLEVGGEVREAVRASLKLANVERLIVGAGREDR